MSPREQIMALAREWGVAVGDLLDDFGERAALLEYDANMSRDEAERQAVEDVRRDWERRSSGRMKRETVPPQGSKR